MSTQNINYFYMFKIKVYGYMHVYGYKCVLVLLFVKMCLKFNRDYKMLSVN